MRFKKSNLKLKEQGRGINMGVTCLLLLGPFYNIQTKFSILFCTRLYIDFWHKILLFWTQKLVLWKVNNLLRLTWAACCTAISSGGQAMWKLWLGCNVEALQSDNFKLVWGCIDKEPKTDTGRTSGENFALASFNVATTAQWFQMTITRQK